MVSIQTAGRFQFADKKRGTFETPEKIQIDQGTTGTVTVAVKNLGSDAFSVRLRTNAVLQNWVRVDSDQTLTLRMRPSHGNSAVSLEVARPKTAAVRFICRTDTIDSVNTLPIKGELSYPLKS